MDQEVKNIDWTCQDCECNTFTEFYMVHNHLWNKVTSVNDTKGLLCICCFEKRLGRELTKGDFTDCPLNLDINDRMTSPLLQRRYATPLTVSMNDTLSLLE